MTRQVLFISNFVGNGGAGRVLMELACELRRRGALVEVLSFMRWPGEYAFDEDIPVLYGPHAESRPEHIGKRRLRREEAAWVREMVSRRPGAVVVSFEYFVNMVAALGCRGLPNRLVGSERNDPSREGGRFPTTHIRNVLYRELDALVCQTPEARDYFRPAVRARSLVIANPVKAGLPAPWTGRRSRRVVNFCRLEPQKNLRLLVEAFSTFLMGHPGYQLEIYGDGSERDALRAFVTDCGLGASVSIRPARQDIHEAVRDAAMFVSTSDYEGLSNSMLEAMALGLPTICTDCPCGGAHLVIRDGENGLLVPVGDRSAVIEAMGRVASDPGFAERLGEEATRVRGDYSLAAICDRWEEVLWP